uniref:Uncharacterized protein n=1 Tax=Setaria italica TaxID=4555 RepID=K3YBA1_SETIT
MKRDREWTCRNTRFEPGLNGTTEDAENNEAGMPLSFFKKKKRLICNLRTRAATQGLPMKKSVSSMFARSQTATNTPINKTGT